VPSKENDQSPEAMLNCGGGVGGTTGIEPELPPQLHKPSKKAKPAIEARRRIFHLQAARGQTLTAVTVNGCDHHHNEPFSARHTLTAALRNQIPA